MSLTVEELKEKIALVCDVCLLCEILDIDEEEILERFEDRLLENLGVFNEMCDYTGDDDVD